MKPASLVQRIGLVVALTVVSVVLHECGHYIVYRLAGYPVRISLQSVKPIGSVDPHLDLLAKFAGPAVSLVAAILLLAVARRRPTFFWATAALTNASLRIFPCVMDLLRALRNGKPFSDEGEVVLAITHSGASRVSIMIAVIALFSVLSIFTGRQFPFENKRALKATSVYLLTFIVGVGIVLADELLGLNK